MMKYLFDQPWTEMNETDPDQMYRKVFPYTFGNMVTASDVGYDTAANKLLFFYGSIYWWWFSHILQPQSLK